MAHLSPPSDPKDLASWWAEIPNRRLELRENEPLFHRGDEVTSMFLVERGSVRLERRTLEGRHLILHLARAGEMIAEGSLFARAYHCDASAAEDAILIRCARTDLAALLAGNPARALAMSARLAAQLQAVRHRLELRNVRGAANRILLHLELRADPVSRQFEITGTLQDIAAEIGLSREAFYRTLSALERSGRIKRTARTIAL